MTRESAISKRIVDWINAQPGCHAEKRWTGGIYSRRGAADIVACVRGRHVEIETKRPGEAPTRSQLMALATWQRAGAVAGMAWSLEDAQAILRPLL